jgi:hypothetical protein
MVWAGCCSRLAHHAIIKVHRVYSSDLVADEPGLI